MRLSRKRLALGGGAAAVLVAVVLAAFVVTGGFGWRDYAARVDSYQRVSDDLHIVVLAMIGYGDPILGYDEREDANGVTVTVHARNRDFGPGTFKNLAGYFVPVTVTLREPLRTRAVFASDGRLLIESTCPGGGFFCFGGR